MSDEQHKNRLARVAGEYWMPADVREAVAWALGRIEELERKEIIDCRRVRWEQQADGTLIKIEVYTTSGVNG